MLKPTPDKAFEGFAPFNFDRIARVQKLNTFIPLPTHESERCGFWLRISCLTGSKKRAAPFEKKGDRPVNNFPRNPFNLKGQT